MSYVELKHLLADLSLEAIREPHNADWASVSAAYAALAEATGPDVPWNSARQEAVKLAESFAWRPDEHALDFLVNRGLLTKRGDRITAAGDFTRHLAYFRRQSKRLLDVLRELGESHGVQADRDVRRGAALFNGGLFFECHEYLEGVWKATTGLERDFYHGIVQVAAAFYHFEKRNWHGARTLVHKGMRKLAGYPDVYLGVKLEAFRRALGPWASHFEDHEKYPEPREYPVVTLETKKRQGAPRG